MSGSKIKHKRMCNMDPLLISLSGQTCNRQFQSLKQSIKYKQRLLNDVDGRRMRSEERWKRWEDTYPVRLRWRKKEGERGSGCDGKRDVHGETRKDRMKKKEEANQAQQLTGKCFRECSGHIDRMSAKQPRDSLETVKQTYASLVKWSYSH